ncbi:MAG: NAD-dependent epimerase/dehydratase family protein [Opitutae bacterium]|nr:NAD-dependent epimerase/dehydratase family protein [Opitutae bacterium]
MSPAEFRRFYKNKPVLITGGLGFIGSNLARTLVGLGARVTLVDSLIPEYGGNRRNIAGLEGKLVVNISDVRDHHSLPIFLRGQEVLFNLAGQTSHMDSMSDPFTDLEINGRAQLSLLEACRKHNPGIRVVFASTRQIYGRPDYLPVDEKHPLRPVDVNGINKLAGEQFHLLYSEVHGIRSTVLRLTNTIGPRMRIKDARQTFVGIWIKNALEGTPFEVWGGEQLRDFTYVDDAVEAFLLAACRREAVGRVFNIGGMERVSLRQLAEELRDIAGEKASYASRKFPEDRKKIDIGDFYSDGTLIEQTLGWKPRVDVRTALRRTVAYFRRELRHYAD